MDEALMRKPVDIVGVSMEEDKKKADSSGDNERCTQEVEDRNKENERDSLKTPPLPNQKNFGSSDNEDEVLESAKAEMGEVMKENQRLKMYLERMMKDYQTLQMQFQGMVKKEGEKESDELVSLSLGRATSSDMKREEQHRSVCVGKDDKKVDNEDNNNNNNDDDEKEGLSLGLPIITDNSSSDEVKEENGETSTWPPSKVLMKTMRNGGGEDEVSQLNPAKRARVSVRVRCDAPTMNDGCQWRKYGQKIAKGNPCPRAYYRCTVAPSCPVRKQVQRCVDDMSILITTYEGTHNHQLPHSATAMASTTSAAACMLMSGSTTSVATSMPPAGSTITAATTPATANLNGLNFYLSDTSKPNPFYIPTSSIAPTLGHPTIVLDLTSTTPSSSSNLSRIGNLGNIGNFPPRFSSTNLNFSSLESNPLPISWNLGTQPYNSSSSLCFGKQQQPPQENQILFQSYLSKNNLNNNNNIPSQSLPQETIAAATKAITADPNFQSALAAALSSIIGTNNNGNGGTSLNLGIHGLAERLSQNLKAPAEPFPILSSFSPSPNPNKCSSSLLSRPTTNSSANPHPGNLMYNLQQTSNSKSSSPGDSRADTK